VILRDLIERRPLVAGESAEKIPWHEPAFSARMLREHLSQAHDAASRRSEVIDRHVHWIHDVACEGRPGRVLDLGCGPGFYTSRMARLGHHCTGIDFSRASIDYARREAERDGLDCEYRLADLTQGGFGGGFDTALFVFGEFNTFERAVGERLLGEAHAALANGGCLVVEAQPAAAVEAIGRGAPSWYSAESGLFSDAPHLVFHESAWNPECCAASERWWVIDADASAVRSYSQTLWAHDEEDYAGLFATAGFSRLERFGSLEGGAPNPAAELTVFVARP
jgi:SAM-dependent methyltransferase